MASETVPACTAPAPLSVADQAAQVLGDIGDTRAMLHGVLSMLDGMEESHVTRLLCMALDRMAETYQRAEALTIATDEAAEVAHG